MPVFTKCYKLYLLQLFRFMMKNPGGQFKNVWEIGKKKKCLQTIYISPASLRTALSPTVPDHCLW